MLIQNASHLFDVVISLSYRVVRIAYRAKKIKIHEWIRDVPCSK
jgi:hypothetical protein